MTFVGVSVTRGRYSTGEQFTFSVRIYPDNATNQNYSIEVTGAIATYDGANTISCVEGGEVTIKATAANGVNGSRTVKVVDLAAFASEVIRLTNVERASNGASSLSQTSALTKTAYTRANEIIRSFSHTRPDGRSCFTAFEENGVSYYTAGENIAMGQYTPDEVVQAWMDSPGHRANILSTKFTSLGVGVTMDGNGTLYWSQSFIG